MRRSLIFLSVFMAGAFIAAGIPNVATAGPVPLATSLKSASAVEKAQYTRRQYRRMARRGLIPGPQVYAGPVVVERGPVIVPLRPRSCGQYRYWNGMACVDARYHDPYIGPR